MALDDLAFVQADGLGTSYICSTLGITNPETHKLVLYDEDMIKLVSIFPHLCIDASSTAFRA
jgi:hypothetical protein